MPTCTISAASNEPSPKGRVSPGVATNEAVSLRPTRSVRVVAASTNSGVRSTPVTWASYVAASRDGPPMPQPTSSSRVPGPISRRSMRVPGRGDAAGVELVDREQVVGLEVLHVHPGVCQRLQDRLH